MGTERYTLLQILQHQALLGEGGGTMQEVSALVDSLFVVLFSVALIFFAIRRGERGLTRHSAVSVTVIFIDF